MLFHYQKQCKPTLIQLFSNTIPKQKAILIQYFPTLFQHKEPSFPRKKQHKTMLNQYFSNSKKYKIIVNQYFSNSIPIPKEEEDNIKPRLFQYYSNAKAIKIILSFTVTTNKHTTYKNPTNTQHNKTNKHTTPASVKMQRQLVGPCCLAQRIGHSWVGTNIADPGIFGLWAQHANHCATPLLVKGNIFSIQCSNWWDQERRQETGTKRQGDGESLKWTAKKRICGSMKKN